MNGEVERALEPESGDLDVSLNSLPNSWQNPEHCPSCWASVIYLINKMRELRSHNRFQLQYTRTSEVLSQVLCCVLGAQGIRCVTQRASVAMRYTN